MPLGYTYKIACTFEYIMNKRRNNFEHFPSPDFFLRHSVEYGIL